MDRCDRPPPPPTSPLEGKVLLHPLPHQRTPVRPIVELNGVSCGYDRQEALTDVTRRIMPGDFVGLLGPSGSGKTTLVRVVLGAVDIYRGEVLVDGVSIRHGRPRTGYVPQLETINLNYSVTVQEVVMMGRTMDSPLYPWYKRVDRVLARLFKRPGPGRRAASPAPWTRVQEARSNALFRGPPALGGCRGAPIPGRPTGC